MTSDGEMKDKEGERRDEYEKPWDENNGEDKSVVSEQEPWESDVDRQRDVFFCFKQVLRVFISGRISGTPPDPDPDPDPAQSFWITSIQQHFATSSGSWVRKRVS